MHEEEKCGCEGQCSCGQQSCGCGSGCGCQESGCESDSCCDMDMLGYLAYAAKEAKMSLLKDKMKKKLEEREGKRLDQMADIAVEALLQSYKDKKDSEAKYQELREKLDSIFEQR